MVRQVLVVAIDQHVPDESTARNLAHRLGTHVVADITRTGIDKAHRDTPFTA